MNIDVDVDIRDAVDIDVDVDVYTEGWGVSFDEGCTLKSKSNVDFNVEFGFYQKYKFEYQFQITQFKKQIVFAPASYNVGRHVHRLKLISPTNWMPQF